MHVPPRRCDRRRSCAPVTVMVVPVIYPLTIFLVGTLAQHTPVAIVAAISPVNYLLSYALSNALREGGPKGTIARVSGAPIGRDRAGGCGGGGWCGDETASEAARIVLRRGAVLFARYMHERARARRVRATTNPLLAPPRNGRGLDPRWSGASGASGCARHANEPPDGWSERGVRRTRCTMVSKWLDRRISSPPVSLRL